MAVSPRLLLVSLVVALAPGAPAALSSQVQPQPGSRTTPPPVGTPKDFRLPASTRFTLPNGMDVVMVPFGTVPKVTVRVVVRAGNVNEDADEVWLADLAGDMLQEGTATRTAEEIARALASMGGTLSVRVGADQTVVGADVLAERGAEAARLVADVVRTPRFPASELARVKANRARALAIQLSQPQTQAEARFATLLYGDHPYGRLFPTEEMLSGYTLDQVRRFHADNYGAARARVYVAGVFDAPAMRQAIEEAFGDWAPGAPPLERPAPRRPERRQVALVDRPGAPQSTIYLGVHVPDPSHDDWLRMEVTDALLGGAFGSRITTNIREQKGYTYSPYSTVRPHVGIADWVEVADVTTDVTGAALTEIFGEIERLRSEAPPSGELRGIQNNLAGTFTLQNATRGGLIGRLAFVDLHGLGAGYLEQYVRRVMAITPDEVRRTAERHLEPDRMTLVVVGDEKVVAGQIARWVTPAP